MGFAGPDYEVVKTDEKGQLKRERVRLWYVALTRACDLLLLPRQNERVQNDWFSLLDADLTQLPTFNAAEISPKIASTELRALSRIVTNPRYSWRSINHLSPGQYRPSEGDVRVPVKSAKIQTEPLPTFLSEHHLDELRAKSGICRYARRNPYALRSRFLFALRQPARRPLQDAPSRRDECVLMTRGKGPNRRVKRL